MILITGSSGFIGSNLIRRLANHDEVIPIDIRNPDYTYLADAACGKSTILIHCANDALSHHNNIHILKKIKKIASQTHASCIFFNSYSTLKGPHTRTLEGFNLGFAPNYLNEYAFSKLKQEGFLEKELPDVRKIYIYLPAVLGKHGVWDRLFFQKMLAASKVILPSKGLGIFNFISIENVCDAILCLLSQQSTLPNASIRIPLAAPQSRHTNLADLPQVLSSVSHKTFEVIFDDKSFHVLHPNFWKNAFVALCEKSRLTNASVMPLCRFLRWVLRRYKSVNTSPRLDSSSQNADFELMNSLGRSVIQDIYIPNPYINYFSDVAWHDISSSLQYISPQ